MSNTDFIQKFYGLQGDLISERKKNFFKLLNAQTTPINEENLINLRPRTYLESLFQVHIFIYFKIFTKLLDVLKDGNRTFVRKILKQPKILKEAIEKISPESFVNDFLPTTSFTVRLKILRKICIFMSQSQMDEIVSLVYARYGFCIAIKILHTCSSKKIKEFICNYDIMLSSRQIKCMFNRDPELLVAYLKRHKKSTGNVYTHNNLSAYIALKNPKIWLKLQKEHVLSFASLGYRTSRSFILDNKKEFLLNIRSYSTFLKFSAIVQELHGNFKEVYAEYFPKDVNNISLGNFCHKLLRYYPRKKQWHLFADTFKNTFGIDILDNLVYLKYGFIQQFGNKSVMNKWADGQYSKDKSNYILTFCEPTKAIPLIKEKIKNSLDLHDKTELLVLLLENCAENEDLIALIDVLNYISSWYLTENKDLKHLHSIASLTLHKIVSLFKLEQLDVDHWQPINEIIAFAKRKKQLDYYYFTDIFTLNLKNIEHLCENGKPFQKELVSFIEDVDTNSTWFHINLMNPRVEKQIWTEIINVYPDVVSDNSKSSKRRQEHFVANIIHFNENNPDYSISLSHFPSLLTYINSIFNQDTKKLKQEEKSILKKIINYNFKFPTKPLIDIDDAQILKIFRDNKKDFCYENFVEKMITKHHRSKFENDVLQLFWDNLGEFHYLNKRIICWLFLNEPRTVLGHFEQLLVLDKKFVDVSYIKLMSHLDFDQKVINFCICKLEVMDNLIKGAIGRKNIFDKRVEVDIDLEIIEILASLLPASKYIEVVANRFLPTRGIKERNETVYLLQCEVAKSFKRIEESKIIIPTLMKYCLDDYMKCVISSLYSICYRVPEEVLYTYLSDLFDMTPWTRKHALFLSCELLKFNYVLNMLQSANESDVSYRRYVFSAILKYFRKHPSEELLNMVVGNLKNIDKDDKGTLNSIAITEIPKKYIDLYIQKCWYFFENMRKKDVNVQNYLQLVLDSITRSDTLLVSLSPDFCRHIVAHYFKETPERDYYLSNIHRYVCMFLIYQKSEQSYNFQFVFKIISEFKKKSSVEVIKNFFHSFYDFAVADIQHNNKIDEENNFHIELFKHYWCDMFTPIRMFDEHVLLNLLYLQCKSPENIVENYAREISVYLEQLIEEYGPFIYYKFKNLLFYKHSFTEKEKHLFFYSLLQFKCSTINCILVIDLLDSYSFDLETKKLYFQIIEILDNSDDPVVAIYFNSRLGDH